MPVISVAKPTVHSVQLYERDAALTESVSRFIGSALASGEVGIVIATAAHRADVERRLRKRGVDLATLRRQRRYVALDAQATLDRLMDEDRVDPARFSAVIGDAVRAAHGVSTGHVHAFGEMVALLWAAGRRQAALDLEQLWNGLRSEVTLSLLCGYPLASFTAGADAAPFLEVCGAHSDVIPAESYTVLGDTQERVRAIAALQQKAHALETEVEQRSRAEAARATAMRELATLATDNARLYEAERCARADAEAANRAKDEFLAMLGHELRNPLSTVRNAVASARLDPARSGRALDVATRATDQLGRLVDDLLDVARITQGKITLRSEWRSLAAIVQQALETTRGLIGARSHALTVSLPASNVEVDADVTRLEQVIVNLVTNAAKYTPPGGRIDVSAEYAGDQAVLRVRDNGIGIAADMLPRVFDLFAQSHRALDRSQGGLGVGLTVVKRLVELHRGTVEAHSGGVGTGAEFVVRLPARYGASGSVPQGNGCTLESRHATSILLVEDNIDAAESLTMLLEVLGHHVCAVNDGPSALLALRSEVPDVMLIDIGLPVMDGYALAQRIRNDLPIHGIVLVALTGYGAEEDRKRALSSGFDDHLTKPVSAETLQALLGRLGRRSTSPIAH